jgi:hypothetical protein
VYDRGCSQCGEQIIDCFEPIEAPEVLCPECKIPTKRIWIGKGASVIGDDIPGGALIFHGLCNADGSPRRYYSKSEIAREAASRGLVNHVEHIPDNKGTDRSRRTTKWF